MTGEKTGTAKVWHVKMLPNDETCCFCADPDATIWLYSVHIARGKDHEADVIQAHSDCMQRYLNRSFESYKWEGWD